MAKKIRPKTDWKKAALAQREIEKGQEREYRKEIRKTIERIQAEISDQIELWYGRYADKTGMTMAEARKKISKADIEHYRRLAKRYVRDRDFSPQANEDMQLYNTMLHINRLSALEAVIGMELTGGFTGLERYISGTLDAGTAAEYDRICEVLGTNVKRPVQRLHDIVHESLKQATWEERLWTNNEKKLRAYLQTTLESALIAGKSPRALVDDMRKHFDASEEDALTLLTTEMTRCQTAAAQLSMAENGDKYYRYLTTNPIKPCPECLALEDKTATEPIRIENMQPGVNAPPMHPNCHCTVAPWIDEREYREWLNNYDKSKNKR